MKTKSAVLSLGSLLAALVLVLFVTTPIFALAPVINNQTLTVAENSGNGTPTTPGTLDAWDPEGKPLTFDIIGGDGIGIFAVDFATGQVTVLDGNQLDYETKTSYTLVVRANDTVELLLSDTAVVTINILDESDEPPSMEDQSFSVPENSPNNTNVGKIVFTDIDVSDSHIFSILSGNGTGLGAFQINSTGIITVKDTTQLNHETTPTFVLSVLITDEGGQQDTATITINVTDINENPNVSDQSFTINENAANDSNVGTVVATDPESGALTFARSGTTAFNINPTSGQVTVADSAQLDFETDPSMTFVVTVTDNGGKTDTATITVNLNDVNDSPGVTGSGIADVIINEGTLSRVVNLWAAFEDDEDADNELSFLVQNISGDALFSADPTINNVNGTLTLNFLPNAAGVANVTIRAFDSQGAFVDDTFKVDVNAAPEAVGYSTVTVNEDAPNSSINLYGGFTDSEQNPSELVYEIVSNTNAGLFSAVTISLPNLVLDYAPDANGQAVITIRATDSGGLSAQTTLNVKVNAVNDPPTTSGIGNVSVSEDAPDTVIDLTKSFDDKEDGSKALLYEVKSNTNPGLFDAVAIDLAADTLTLNYKSNTSGTATLTIGATDNGVPGVPNSSQSVETSFTVTVGGVNDAPIVTGFSKNTNEDVPVQFTLNDFTSKFSDDDGDTLANVRIQTLPANGTLKLGSANVTVNQVIDAAQLGTLSFVPALNWDQGSTSFEWNASDGTAYAAVPATVTITVQAVNDAPTISSFEKSGQEGVNVLFTQSDFTAAFADVDGDSLAKIRIENLPANGSLKLGNSNVTVNQQINLSNLGDLRYVPNQYFFGTDSFSWSGSDGALYSSPAQVTLNIAPQNDPPSLDLDGGSPGTGFAATFVAGGAPVVIAGAALNIDDIDSETMQSATVIIVNRQHGSLEILDADTTGTAITKSFSAGSGVLFLTGADTIANYEKVLKTVTYQISSDVANPNTDVVRNVSFRVNDGEDNSNDAVAKVTIINPRISVTVTPGFQTIPKGSTAVFTIVVENIGNVDLENIVVTSAAVPDCDREFETLEAGESLTAYACLVSQVQERVDNKVVVTARDVEVGSTVTDDAEAVVRVLRDIIVDISAAPAVGDTLIKGQDAVFNVTVINPSEAKLKSVQVKAFVDYDLAAGVAMVEEAIPAPECDKIIGDLNAGKESTYSCTIPNVQASFQIEVQATGLIDGITETEDFDLGEIGVLDLSLEAFASPFEILADQPTTVEFSLTLANISNVPLTLSTLESNLHGNLLNAGNNGVSANTCPGLSLAIPAGEVRSCSYEVTVSLQPPALTNVITALVANEGNKQLTVTDEALVSVAEFSPLEVTLTASPASLVAPGGTVNVTAQVTNNTSTELTIDALNDSVLGNLNGKGNCLVPRVVAGNGSYSCTYPVTISGKQPGEIATYTVTAVADSKEATDSVAIPITSSAQVQVRLPMVSSLGMAGEPNNSVCAAMPIMTNIDNYFLANDTTDWYRVTLAAPARLKVKLSGFQVPGQLVAYGGNCTAPGNPIGHNGDLGIIPNRELDLGVQQAGTYFVWVIANAGSTSTVPYVLRVESTAP